MLSLSSHHLAQLWIWRYRITWILLIRMMLSTFLRNLVQLSERHQIHEDIEVSLPSLS